MSAAPTPSADGDIVGLSHHCSAALYRLGAVLTAAGLSATLLANPVRLRVRHPNLSVVGLTVTLESTSSNGTAPLWLQMSTGPRVPGHDIATAAAAVLSEIGRYVKLSADELTVEARPTTLADLRRRFPNIHTWHGQHTRTCWAMTRDRYGRDRLIEAPDPFQLGRRLERVITPKTGAAPWSTPLGPADFPISR
ncbi:hypothetical protein ACFQ07_01395 [Actinomadura adrarensis]|uniref:Uncharacterized protein n=1 Tax=Actinomadura adrarensis TaxID=1819600 RepID=A0ABW3C8U4_9ACTN